MKIQKGTVTININIKDDELAVEAENQESCALYVKELHQLKLFKPITLAISPSPVTGFRIEEGDRRELEDMVAVVNRRSVEKDNKRLEERKHRKVLYFPCYYAYGGHELIYDDRDPDPLPSLISDGKKALRCCYEEEKIESLVRQEWEEIIAKRNKRSAERAAVADRAKVTGKKELWRQYAVECDRSVDECDVDTIYIYINPDGTETRKRSHNF